MKVNKKAQKAIWYIKKDSHSDMIPFVNRNNSAIYYWPNYVGNGHEKLWVISVIIMGPVIDRMFKRDCHIKLDTKGRFEF